MDRTITQRLGAIALLSALVVSACGGAGASPTPTRAPATSAAAATSAPAATTAPAESSPPAESTPPAESSPPTATTAPAESTPPAASSPPSGLTGEIFVSGSSTVGPISAGVKELFNESNPGVAITVDEPGTGDGFALFCKGETDISDASRAIRDSEGEKPTCAANGVEYVELKVAIDGLSVITSAQNATIPEDCLSFADLYALIGPEAGPTATDADGFTNWKDAQAIATELGSKTVLPDAPLTITAPGEESGTFDSFVELVITKLAEAREQEVTTRPDYQSSGNDTVIIDGVAGTADNNTTLGWVGYAYAQNATDKVKLLKVDDGESGCIEPTQETIASGEYPIARDLYIYVNKAKAAANPALAAYVDFYLAEGTLANVLQNPDARYVPLPADAWAATVAAWAAR